MTQSEAIQTLMRHSDQLVSIRDSGGIVDSCLAESVLALIELVRALDPAAWTTRGRYERAVAEVNETE